jgi:hypothetical protein
LSGSVLAAGATIESVAIRGGGGTAAVGSEEEGGFERAESAWVDALTIATLSAIDYRERACIDFAEATGPESRAATVRA